MSRRRVLAGLGILTFLLGSKHLEVLTVDVVLLALFTLRRVPVVYTQRASDADQVTFLDELGQTVGLFIPELAGDPIGDWVSLTVFGGAINGKANFSNGSSLLCFP